MSINFEKGMKTREAVLGSGYLRYKVHAAGTRDISDPSFSGHRPHRP